MRILSRLFFLFAGLLLFYVALPYAALAQSYSLGNLQCYAPCAMMARTR